MRRLSFLKDGLVAIGTFVGGYFAATVKDDVVEGLDGAISTARIIGAAVIIGVAFFAYRKLSAI